MTYSTMTNAQIRDFNASIEGTTIAPLPLKRTRTAAKPQQDWRQNPASDAQVDRIFRCEEAILESGRKRGIKLIARHQGSFANAGKASDYYQTLAAFGKKHGLRWTA